MKNISRDILFGVAIGDALGVPVEFEDRQSRVIDPVVNMRGYGTYAVPAGTFSDDASMTFCTAESLAKGYSLVHMGHQFANWAYQSFWTATGSVFDIGITTSNALRRFIKDHDPTKSGAIDEGANGNGSLMRILPLVTIMLKRPIEERWEMTKAVSSITHAHIRSVISCFIYLEYARQLVMGREKAAALAAVQKDVRFFLPSVGIDSNEVERFERILSQDFANIPQEKIFSSGYCVHTLEAAIWCVLSHDNYSDTVLRAVNMGSDTDTTAAVAGGLAGLLYGADSIPAEWMTVLARREDIEDLAERLYANVG